MVVQVLISASGICVDRLRCSSTVISHVPFEIREEYKIRCGNMGVHDCVWGDLLLVNRTDTHSANPP